MYIYESHSGNGFYFSEKLFNHSDLYCETCNDSDELIGYAETLEEARLLMEYYREDYNDDYIDSVLLEIEELLRMVT